MDGEINLELYTLCMIQINNIFQKIADNNPTDEIIADINNCRNDLKQLHEEIVDDLSKEEINIIII